MENVNKVLITTCLCFAIFATPVFAATISNQKMPIYYNFDNGVGQQTDKYVTTQVSGTLYESHTYNYLTPLTFRADLELRTAWYLPNEIKDSTYSPSSYNRTSCTLGQQFRTYCHATGQPWLSPGYTQINTNYSNY